MIGYWCNFGDDEDAEEDQPDRWVWVCRLAFLMKANGQLNFMRDNPRSWHIHRLDGELSYGQDEFTHWKPLPAPPKFVPEEWD
jgi:hypothetical protein